MNAECSVRSSSIAALRLILACCAVFGAGYPLAVLAAARVVAPEAAEGSLVRAASGGVLGSALVAQAFTKPEWFWPRPSAVGYNAAATGGSNLAPGNPALAKRVSDTIEAHRAAGDDVSTAHPLPLDLAFASGSGLDPEISTDAARFQAPRVAAARRLRLQRVNELIAAHTTGTLVTRFTGAAPTVNVLHLNLALSRLSEQP